MKVTADSAGGYLLINSDTWPRLLDLMGQTISLYVWAAPETADDASVVIQTTQADGTSQTLTSSTSTPAGEFTLIKLEDQSINDDLTEIEIRFRIATNGEVCYFDHARLIGRNTLEYLLPIDLRDGDLTRVMIQADSNVDALAPQAWETIHGWSVTTDGSTDKYLQLPYLFTGPRLIRLVGYKPLSIISAYTDTVEVGDEQVNLLIAYAKYKLYQSIEGPTSSMDKRRYETDSAKAYGEYLRLRGRLRMIKPRTSLRMTVY